MTDFENALHYAKLSQPDYPWSASPTMSEIVWALTTAYEGCSASNDDLHKLLQILLVACKGIEPGLG